MAPLAESDLAVADWVESGSEEGAPFLRKGGHHEKENQKVIWFSDLVAKTEDMVSFCDATIEVLASLACIGPTSVLCAAFPEVMCRFCGLFLLWVVVA